MPIFSLIGYNLPDSFYKNLTIDKKFINKQVSLLIHQTMCLKRSENKKLLGRHNKVAKWFYYFKKNTEVATCDVL